MVFYIVKTITAYLRVWKTFNLQWRADAAIQLTCRILWKFKFNYVVSSSYYKVMFHWKLETSKSFFWQNQFFSAQLVSVQKLSSFFPLRKVCKLRKVRKIFLKTTIYKTTNLRWLFHSKKAVAQLFPAKSASPCFFYFLLEKGYVFGKDQKSQ